MTMDQVEPLLYPIVTPIFGHCVLYKRRGGMIDVSTTSSSPSVSVHMYSYTRLSPTFGGLGLPDLSSNTSSFFSAAIGPGQAF